jgi:2-amino-4-hydroxy-6-hydroxymethyldihydropteridine diphosphokinase/dihydropteroate synthase
VIILGLGTNIGDRLQNLRKAYQYLKKNSAIKILRVSSIYESPALLPEGAPSSWDVPYFNVCLQIETTLTPDALLQQTKNIEKLVGRKPELEWGPRVMDIDILAWDQCILTNGKLHIPHEHLHERPFAIFPFAEIAPFWIYPLPGILQGKTAIELALQWGNILESDTKIIPHRIDFPELMGIINVTPDSFSDGGNYSFDLPMQLVNAGATILDFGAEATGPKAIPLDHETEWQRLQTILKKCISEKNTSLFSPKISVDTYHPEVAKKVLECNVDWINDVTGLDNIEMRELLAAHTCDVVFMHHLGIPVSQSKLIPLHEDPVTHVYQWAEKRIAMLESSGIQRARLIFDVGIGFGKTAEQSLELIKNISVFHRLNVRLLVGHSRKSFLKTLTSLPPKDRDLETAIISLHLADAEVDYLRVHNIVEQMRVFKTRACF